MFFQRHKRDIPYVQKKTKRFAFDPSDAFVKCEAREKYAVLSSRVQFPLLHRCGLLQKPLGLRIVLIICKALDLFRTIVWALNFFRILDFG